MSEKRFTDVNVDFEESWIRLKDNGDFLIFPISFNDKEEYGLDTLEDLLNEMSDKIDEQQATIRKLQDLCGKSDGENAKLRIENKMLEKEVKLLKPTNLEQYEQIQKLQKENEKLRKELGDCEKFRYTVFQRMRDVLDE